MTGITEITLPIPAEFIDLCRANNLTPRQVLAAFMADLADTAESNGSDERRHADAWFDRVVWPEPPERTYNISERSVEFGGGWTLHLMEDGEEVSSQVFPADPSEDPEDGIAWWNSLPEAERETWMKKTGDTGRVVDAYALLLTDAARQEAEDAGEDWVESKTC